MYILIKLMLDQINLYKKITKLPNIVHTKCNRFTVYWVHHTHL